MDYYVSRYQGLLRHPWMHENHNTFSGTPKGRCHARYCVIPRWYRSKKPSTFLITSSHARPFNWLLMRSNKIITAVNFRTRNHILLLFACQHAALTLPYLSNADDMWWVTKGYHCGTWEGKILRQRMHHAWLDSSIHYSKQTWQCSNELCTVSIGVVLLYIMQFQNSG